MARSVVHSIDLSPSAARLTEHHRDPVDRFIIATAIERQASVISFDATFPAYMELTGRLIDR